MTIYLATSRKRPNLTPSDDLLCQELEARGQRVIAAPWDSIHPEAGSLTCIRSTWDYHLRPEEFKRWIRSAERSGRLINPPDTILWNIDKVYLREIGSRGIRIPASQWCEPGVRPDLKQFLKETGADRCVIKPRVSATAYGTHLIGENTRLPDDEWEKVLGSGALLQRFVSEVESQGEISLVYFAGRFSHAVQKRTAPGDFRVQSDFGGSFGSVDVSPALRGFGEKVLEAARHPALYARVDVIETSSGPTLMELELIEPDLFLGHGPGAAKAMAEALLAQD